jgi:hypothetical protein
VIPLTLANVHGIVPGVSAHVSIYGYLPAAPVSAPGEASRLFVLWLTGEQLKILDSTEPNYHRRRLPEHRFPVDLAPGVPLPGCEVYVGRHGCLAESSSLPMRLEAQPRMIGRLLARSPELRRLCGDSPEEFVERVRDRAVREAATAALHAGGFVRRQPDLVGLDAEDARMLDEA